MSFWGVRCPSCGKDVTAVLDSRPCISNRIRRRRQCKSCQFRFTTQETTRDEDIPSEVWDALKTIEALTVIMPTQAVKTSMELVVKYFKKLAKEPEMKQIEQEKLSAKSQEILKAKAAGVPVIQISKLFALSRARIYQILNRHAPLS